jgi:hypothetical protein
MIVVPRQPTEGLVPARYDRQIYMAATAALASSPYAPLRYLKCSVADGKVEISGTVTSYYLKQLAQAAIMQIERVDSVRNLVEVTGEPAVLVSTNCRPGADGP